MVESGFWAQEDPRLDFARNMNEGPTLVAPSGVPIGKRFRKRKFIQKIQKLLIY